MMSDSNSYPKAVVVLAAARDRYQLPLALHEGGLLQKLVTDLYWPADRNWFSLVSRVLMRRRVVAARFCPGLESSRVSISKKALGAVAMGYALPGLDTNRFKDKALSRRGCRLALDNNAALFCCNYYASEAFKHKDRLPFRFLFQLQPDFLTMRRILVDEMERIPAAKDSILFEHEMSLAGKELEELCSEPVLANGWVTTSSFAAQTLAERGIPEDKIHVVPYGVESDIFSKRPHPPDSKKPFKVIFAGGLIQRKGLSYLLEGVRLLKSRKIKLTLCTRGFIDKQLLADYSDLDLEIKLGLSGSELAYEMHSSDVFLFPSIAEGFGLVILETMSCGLPVITTKHTCGPDVMVDGQHGFLVPVRDAEAIAEKLTWGVEHRAELAAMGEAAAAQARLFTWERFRAGVRAAYAKMVDSAQ